MADGLRGTRSAATASAASLCVPPPCERASWRPAGDDGAFVEDDLADVGRG
jgi:hypothetical protein